MATKYADKKKPRNSKAGQAESDRPVPPQGYKQDKPELVLKDIAAMKVNFDDRVKSPQTRHSRKSGSL